jgi:hypothetical protein
VRFTRPTFFISLSVCEKDFLTGDYSRRVSDCRMANDGATMRSTIIFDAFADDAGRDAHLSGKVAKALMEKASELLAEPPKIEKADVLADRLLG